MIFVKPVTEISTADLQELLTDHTVENLRLEFKREIATKDETLKKLSAFANTIGGLIVIGAEAGGDGRIAALPGVVLKSGYKQTIVQWCFEGASPPLDVDVSDAIPSPTAADRVCYVIGVRESDLGPHFLNGRKGVYVRSNEFSSRFDAQLANENELRHLLHRRQLVRERRDALLRRSRERFETFAVQKYDELGKRKEGMGARFDMSIGPRFPAHAVCGQARVMSVLPTINMPWRSVGFPRSTGGGLISQHESAIVLRPGSSFSILEANTWGMLYYATEVEREGPKQSEKELDGIHSYHFPGQLLVFLEHAGRLLSELGYVGPLTIEMKLDGIRGVPWIVFDGQIAYTGPASQLDDTATFSIETTTDELTKARDTVAMNLLRYVFYATNLTDAVSAASLETYVKGGYYYNGWNEPNTLRV